MATPAKVLFIGLDAGDPGLIDSWANEGLLPNLKKLRDRSVSGAVESPAGLGSGAMWPSLFTGVNPARHGRYFHRQVWPGTYHASKFHPSQLGRAPFWDALSAKNLKVAAIDIPKMPISRDVNGMVLVDWMVHSSDYDRCQSWPPTIVSDVAKEFGLDTLGKVDAPGRDFNDFKHLRDSLLQKVRKKTELSVRYLAKGGWDMFMTVYGEMHDAGHEFWHVHDPSFSGYNRDLARLIGDPIRDVYQLVDEGIGRILDEVSSETVVLCFAGPGMGPNYGGNFLLDRILRRLEGGDQEQERTNLETLKSIWRGTVPRKIRKHFRAIADRADEVLLANSRKQRKCFQIPHNEITGAIRINLVGREPEGKIRPGKDYDEFVEQLSRDLLDLVHLETGKSVVDEVIRIREIFKGHYIDDLPDLLVKWNRYAPIHAVGSPKLGKIRGTYPGNRTGDHTDESVFFANGPGIEPRHLNEPVSVMDFAPTIAALLGTTLEDVDGTVIPAIVNGTHATN